MNTVNPEKSILVFDLDDTLYSEFDYKVSGIRSVIQTLAALYTEYSTEELEAAIDFKKNDWLDTLCRICRLNDTEKQVLLWQYRLHKPNIKPYCGIDFLTSLTKRFAAAALISDGRSLTQRLKLDALGIMSLFDDILISEAFQSEKPDNKRFAYLENKYRPSAEYFIYIGDNIKKDFVAPKKMGWLTIGLKPSADNIHSHRSEDFATEYHPDLWISSLEELDELFPCVSL